MTEHELKTWPEAFAAVLTGEKTFEVRRDDRAFVRGDMLILREWDPQREIYTGRRTLRRAAYILDGGQFGVEAGFVVIALAVPIEKAAVLTDAAGLASWHAGEAQNARLRAATWRQSAASAEGLQRARYEGAADLGDLEAAFHDRAAELARGVAAETVVLTCPLTDADGAANCLCVGIRADCPHR